MPVEDVTAACVRSDALKIREGWGPSIALPRLLEQAPADDPDYGGPGMSNPSSRGPLKLPAPGTFGHYAYADDLARRRCVYCRLVIGYERAYWFVTPLSQEVMHDGCWWTALVTGEPYLNGKVKCNGYTCAH